MQNKNGEQKSKAWEFVSVFPENERGTYGRRIAESKWQSQTPSPPPRPSKATPITKVSRPFSSPNHQVTTTKTRRNYHPPPYARHTYGGQIGCSQPTNYGNAMVTSPPCGSSPAYSSSNSPVYSTSSSPRYSPMTSPHRSNPTSPNRVNQSNSPNTNSPIQFYVRPQSGNYYEQMKVDDGPEEIPSNTTSYFQVTQPARNYSNSSSMSSSVVGSKSSQTNISRTCPLSSSDPNVQHFLEDRNSRKGNTHY